MEISKQAFIEAYNAYPPNAFTKFAFKYFSGETSKSDKWLMNIFVGILVLLFLFGFIGTIMNWDSVIIKSLTYGFFAILAILVPSLFVAVFMNNWRIRKIRKKLGGISKSDYNFLSDKYLLSTH